MDIGIIIGIAIAVLVGGTIAYVALRGESRK